MEAERKPEAGLVAVHRKRTFAPIASGIQPDNEMIPGELTL